MAAVYVELDLEGVRPRYAPVLRALAAAGPGSIQELAAATGVTHSAASRTAARPAKDGLVAVGTGSDGAGASRPSPGGRSPRCPRWTPSGGRRPRLRPPFEAELRFPLSELVGDALEALRRRPMRERILDAAPHPPPPGR
ncbi:MarR family transcriptional regulator [Streptomyces sp. NPDC048389]|uniref:MarR family transcriptional regulator n=1 Tax=Streptomyces sp. NPDC048389 TaxID=3154622 RepID=UPI0034568071